MLDLAALVAELVSAHGVHTIILYGSYARGDATPESDIDVAGFADVERTMRDARLWHGTYLDGFVYPTALATAPTPAMVGMCGGRALLDERRLAAPLLARLAAMDAEPPAPLTADDAQMRRVWAQKMLGRIRRGDVDGRGLPGTGSAAEWRRGSVEANYRRHWLLFQLLEDYFALRGESYRGPKLALAELERRSPATFALFAAALAPDATIEAIAALVTAVR